MLKSILFILLLAALAYAAWIEWSILSSAGLLWGIFFGFFIVPFALFAVLGFAPKKIMARE
ncbi:hypothetical protein GEOBRER4_n1153 [Citrifermentans bremense]|uniref:Uncharacterized protein n=1 Tax=Citrifermentans bremense TaxID=60035 RepID=A0A6S6LZE1_9BACT|nr:hypothetical protein [Citrifermentans bremense]BCG46360.1 hypothetical protein GEOBRER4_n1153 [Citrifermentans bremense]